MPEKKQVLDTVLYTTESKKSKGRTNASLKAEDPANEEEFNRIVADNAIGETQDNVHTTGNDRRTGGGGNR